MKKSLYIIIAALLISNVFSACTPSETDGTKSDISTAIASGNPDSAEESAAGDKAVTTEDVVKVSFTGDLTINKEGEGAEICGAFESIVSLLNGGDWIRGTQEKHFKYTFGINDKTIKYDAGSGMFYNETDSLYMTVSEADKTSLNETLNIIFERIYEDW